MGGVERPSEHGSSGSGPAGRPSGEAGGTARSSTRDRALADVHLAVATGTAVCLFTGGLGSLGVLTDPLGWYIAGCVGLGLLITLRVLIRLR